jgi:hypothetical protein
MGFTRPGRDQRGDVAVLYEPAPCGSPGQFAEPDVGQLDVAG